MEFRKVEFSFGLMLGDLVLCLGSMYVAEGTVCCCMIPYGYVYIFDYIIFDAIYPECS